MNKKIIKEIIISIIILLVILLVTVLLHRLEPDGTKFKNEYESYNDSSVVMDINKNNPIKYVNFDELIDKLTSGTNVVYFGFPNCPWCRNAIPVLFDVAKSNNVNTIYYFNPKEIRSSDNSNYIKLLELLNGYLEKDENGNDKLYVPDVYFIKDGKIVGNHLSTVDSQTDPHVVLNDSQKEELKSIYQDLFNKLK